MMRPRAYSKTSDTALYLTRKRSSYIEYVSRFLIQTPCLRGLRKCSAIIVALLVGLTFFSPVFAATDDFTVRTIINDDTTPPTVPAGLNAVPIADTQINLSWNPSTDDFLMGGYYVYRDDVQIATTTGTSYSDVGLTASTTYAYYITAFDYFNNVSASSTVVATTTLNPPPPPPTPTTTPRTGLRQGTDVMALVSLTVTPYQDSVLIRYETRGHVQGVIRWGQTPDYELGSLVERSFTTVHETRITGLAPGTTYYFSISGEHTLGIRGVLAERSFTTLASDDVYAPTNVSNLRAVRDGDDVVLSWDNPADPDFSHVRVLRSTDFYPSDIADGWLVYEGKEATHRDNGVSVPGAQIYYTVFSYDATGNISSGAVVTITIPGGGVKPVVPRPVPVPVPTASTTTGTTTAASPVPTNSINLAFTDLRFIQGGVILAGSLAGTVSLDGAQMFTLAIPYDRLPRHLKTILVTLAHPTDTDKTFSFLLRANHDKTFYEAAIAPLGISGTFPVRVSVFDFKTAQIGDVSGVIVTEIIGVPTEEVSSLAWYERLITWFLSDYRLWLALFVLILIVLITLYYVRSRD